MSDFTKQVFEIPPRDPALEDDGDDLSISQTTVDGNTSSSNGESDDELARVKQLISRETKIVGVWRFIVTAVMLAIAATVTVATHKFLTEQEAQDWESSFDQITSTISDSLTFNARSIRLTYKSFSDQVTSYALQENLTWPFVTLPNVAVHGHNLRQATGTLGFWITHLVTAEQVANWSAYTMQNNNWYKGQFVPTIYTVPPGTQNISMDIGAGPYAPVWQMDPTPVWPLVNFDMLPHQPQYDAVVKLREGVMGAATGTNQLVSVFSNADSYTPSQGEPYSSFSHPIFDSFDEETSRIPAMITGFVRWGTYLAKLLPPSQRGINVVLDTNSCNSTFSWELVGPDAVFLGEGDFHDPKFDEYSVNIEFNVNTNETAIEETGRCVFDLYVYPSSTFVEQYTSNIPMVVTIVVAAVFASMILLFFGYDLFQRRRNNKVIVDAARSNAVVSSLFPSTIRDRLMKRQKEDGGASPQTGAWNLAKQSPKAADKDDLLGASVSNETSSPIADLFPNTTVGFIDLAGFTAWSSVREPSQVFTLLETLYGSFDEIAKKRKVFKVETVGDCYVAVCGLPNPNPQHATVMARFAKDCLQKSEQLTKALETTLGPDTGDLTVRIGLHSGQVTAGVLRGDRARFQLFGDTVNTTARLESTGEAGRIHISKETATLLIKAGKGNWVEARKDSVAVKGKGVLSTYWLKPSLEMAPSEATRATAVSFEEQEIVLTKDVVPRALHIDEAKRERLINWQVDVFSKILKQIIARRRASNALRHARGKQEDLSAPYQLESTPMKEVLEIIELPEFDAEAAQNQESPDEIELDSVVEAQLRNYIATISHMYKDNAFHNFEHASHVSMSVTKLLSRIHQPSDMHYREDKHVGLVRSKVTASSLHDHTFGITSDPLTHFSLVFGALIHDVDHSGVPNTQLIQENPQLANTFDQQSVAEQNSIVLAWDLLMQPEFTNLRQEIYHTSHEMYRFRQLLVQTVLATDIADKELKALRNERWARAFDETGGSLQQEAKPRDDVNRKATIVIEHLIQASDVAHTMQHWHVYRKWNERFFLECYKSFLDGRAEKDPSEGWYKGEMGFFDFYIIPLAKKLKDCGVFGVSSDEYLNFALKNREEWECRGQEVVAEMSAKAKQLYGWSK